MRYRSYQHVERIGTSATDGILSGECYVYPKIDGTNAVCWMEDGIIKGGSRKRELTLENDNAGFYNQIINDDRLKKYLEKHPTHTLYGEFLIPHSLKTYQESAWRKFYVFDIITSTGMGDEEYEYLPYEVYKFMLDEFEIEYIPPIAIVTNPSLDTLYGLLEKNMYLIKDGFGCGEGIVVKNYNGYRNKFGRIVWGKIVTNEFKAQHYKAMGVPIIKEKGLVEEKIVDKYATDALIDKEYSKISNEQDGWSSKSIPKLLNMVYYSLVSEECWNFVKEFKSPTIDFKLLMNLTYKKVKESKSELF